MSLRGRRTAPGAVALALLLSGPALSMDLVRPQIGADAASVEFGVSGRGVLVAILDRGIDWKNADFRKPDGTTRIAYIFDLTDDGGASENPYGMGTLYTRSQIDAALAAGSSLPTRDALGHGTATAGIAAGSGRNSPGGKYRGIAPEATLLVVKVVADGTPAHDGEPAEEPFFQPERIPVAIDFIRAKAQELGIPCVMLLNLGSQGGPTDGTSELARKIDATVGSGIPGLLFVTGTGDDGGMPNRAAGTVGQGDDVPISIQKGDGSTPLFFDLWYPGSDRLDVLSISTPLGTYGPYASPATNTDWDIVANAAFTYYHLGSAGTFYGAQNGKREIWIRIDGPAGVYTVTLHGAFVASGHFDATLNPSQFWNGPSANFFLDHAAPGSIWDGATALSNIAPNSWVIRTSWTDIDGIDRTLVGEGDLDDLWRGSSVGPTFDGRFGVDFSAPGDRVVTTYNPKSWWATLRYNLIDDGNGLYGISGAVSAASPTVVGVIALMLQRNPALDAVQAKRILQVTARSDAFTGPVPNNVWGFGKLDARGAVALSRNAGGPPVTGIQPSSGPAQGGTAVTISGTNFQPGARATIGNVPAPGTEVTGPEEIGAKTPPLSPGALHDVVVINPDMGAGVLTKGFLADFTDVPQAHVFHSFIEALFRGGVTSGCGGGKYCPANSVTRAQMAVFLLRGKHGSDYQPPPATGTAFSDVPAGAFAGAWIEQLAAEGITSGCGGGKYCPDSPVTREQMALFLLKAKLGSDHVPPAPTGIFGDVPVSNPFAKWIEELASLGITSGCGGGNFCPTASVTRGQMAVFLVKTFELP